MTIAVHDGFLARHHVAMLFERLNARGWTYGWMADRSSNGPARHWHIGLADNGYQAERSCLPELEALSAWSDLLPLWDSIARMLPQGHQPTRVYANAHTYGVDGSLHTDCPPGTGERTALIYLNPVWKPAWGGVTLFTPAESEPLSVMPKPGRLVIFPGDIPHCACAPMRSCHDLRVTLVFKSKVLP